MPTICRSLAEKVEYVEGQIRDLGLIVKPTSRLAREASVLRGADGNWREVPADDPQHREAIEALRDYTLFEYTLENWPFPYDHRVTRLLKRALKDAVDPHALGGNTPGRDTQLELFIAAALHKSGLEVELELGNGMPDVRTRVNRKYFYVEAKRPRSFESIVPAVEKAASQIRNAGCPGAVFLDVSIPFNPKGEFILRHLETEAFNRLHGEAISKNIRLIEGDLRRAVAGKQVGSVWFQSHMLRQLPGAWVVGSCCIEFRVVDTDNQMGRDAAAFRRAFDRAWL